MRHKKVPDINHNRPHVPLVVLFDNEDSLRLGITEALWDKKFGRVEELTTRLKYLVLYKVSLESSDNP